MAGQRQAKLQPVEYLPGILSDVEPRSATSRFKDCNWVRWNRGYAEKMGGTEVIPLVDQLTAGTTYVGAARSVIDWADLGGKHWIATGTNKKLYVITAGLLYDITPLRKTSNVSNPFTTVSGSPIVTVADADHRASTGDYIRIYDGSAVGGLTLAGSYQITDVTGPNAYTITASGNASSSTTGGGTPTIEYDINGGLESNGELLGYGTGPYGEGTYGTPREVGTGVQGKMRTWSLDNWGEDLMASYNNGPIYWWDRTNGPSSRATLISGGPPSTQRILVNPENGYLIALGASDTLGNPDAMRVAWCEQGDFNTWLTIENVSDVNNPTAGGKRLDNGSRIVTGIKTRGQNLVWTDTQLYGMQFLNGDTNVFGFTPLGACSIVGPNAAVDANGIAYAMCFDDFYIYDGVLRAMPCEVWNRVFGDFDRTQAEKVTCSSNRAQTEIRWDYPSLSGSGENDRYVIFNYGEGENGCWYYGTQVRTAMHDVSEAMTGYRTNPYGLAGGKLYKHDVGTDFIDGAEITVPPWFLETYDGNIGGSDAFYLINKLVPSFTRIAGIVRATFYTKSWPMQPTYNTKGPYNIEEDSIYIGVRVRSSQIALRLESTGAEGEDFRMGTLQVLATPYTKRGGGNSTTTDPFAVVLSGTTDGIDTNTLTWTASAGGTFAVAGYRLFNADDDVLIFDSASPNIRAYDHTGLAAGTFNYYVKAYDRKGMLSDESNNVSLVIAASASNMVAATGCSATAFGFAMDPDQDDYYPYCSVPRGSFSGDINAMLPNSGQTLELQIAQSLTTGIFSVFMRGFFPGSSPVQSVFTNVTFIDKDGTPRNLTSASATYTPVSPARAHWEWNLGAVVMEDAGTYMLEFHE